MWEFHRAMTWLFALAPAFLCSVACFVANAHALAVFANKAVDEVRHDKVALEVLAEVLVHLSTYGTALVGFVLHAAFDAHLGVLGTAALSVLWMVTMVQAAIAVRRVVENLHG